MESEKEGIGLIHYTWIYLTFSWAFLLWIAVLFLTLIAILLGFVELPKPTFYFIVFSTLLQLLFAPCVYLFLKVWRDFIGYGK